MLWSQQTTDCQSRVQCSTSVASIANWETIEGFHVKVHDIGAHAATSLPTETGQNTLNDEPTLPQKPSSCASCSVVAMDVKETATPTAARRLNGDAAREQCGKDEARCTRLKVHPGVLATQQLMGLVLCLCANGSADD